MSRAANIDLSIIIVSYNCCEYTIRCLESVYKETVNISYEVIVIDNASKDETVSSIKRKFPMVKLIDSAENLGFAQGNNVAAADASGDYILLLNPDTEILDNAVERLFKFAKNNPKSGIYGGRTIYPDGSLNRSCYSKMTPWSLFCSTTGLNKLFKSSTFFNSITYGTWNYDSVRQADIIVGCFLMIKRDLWMRLNGFNPLFFMYAEEADLCLRAAKLGYTPQFTPEAEIIHYEGVSEPTEATKIIKTLRGHITLMKEHWPKLSYFIGLLLFLLKVRIKSLGFFMLSLVNNKKFDRSALVWKEVWRERKVWVKGWYNREQK